MQLLITGASAGIGRALASAMVREGHAVWGVARTEHRLASLAEELGPSFRFSSADVSKRADLERVVRELDAAGFAPEVVVLNAGISSHDSDQDFDSEISESVLATNLEGPLAFVSLLLKPFLARGSGQFIAVSSIFGLRPDPLGVGYAASKAGLNMAFRSLRVRYRATPIQFKTILLGPITTPGQGRSQFKRFSPHLRSAEAAAGAIRKLIDQRQAVVCYPPLVGWAMQATTFLPDTIFEALTKPFKR